MPFSLSPYTSGAGEILDYSTPAGEAHYKAATDPLDRNQGYALTSGDALYLLSLLRMRAQKMG